MPWKKVIPECEGKSLAERRKIYYRRRNEKHPYRNLKWTLGWSPEEYVQKLEAQNGVCAICGKAETFRATGRDTPRRLAADHNHETGVHRGLLCGMCNTALGKFGDDIKILEAAVAYLKKWNT